MANPKLLTAIAFLSTSILFTLCAPAKPNRYKPTAHITINDRELVPEGIAINRHNGDIYISSLHKKKIVLLDPSGKTTDLIKEGEQGFMWGLGMKVSDDGKKLWACTAGTGKDEGKTFLFLIDLSSKKILDRFTHDSANFFNDVALHDNGTVFITDTERGSVFRLDPLTKRMEEWLRSEELTYANGITIPPHNHYMFVASGSRGLKKIDIGTKRISPLSTGEPDYAIDGLIALKGNLVGVIGWPQDKPETHRVIHFQLNENFRIVKRDTLAIGKSILNCPTTIAWHEGKLYVLAKTNLGAYNVAKYDIGKAALVDPAVVVLTY